MLKGIIKQSKIEDWLRDGTEGGEARVENVKELLNVTIKYGDQPWLEAMPLFLEEVALVSEIDKVEDEKKCRDYDDAPFSERTGI